MMQVCAVHLISICMAAYDDGFLPGRYKARYVRADDGLTEDSTTQNVPYCSIRTFPHILQLEL